MTVLGRCFIAFGAAMCVFSALLPTLLPRGNLHVMETYSLLVMLYEVATAAFITITAIVAWLRRRPYSIILLCGFLVLDIALVMDRILPMHEPIMTGWFHELASFTLILCIGVAVGREMAAKYRENTVLIERQAGMEQYARMQKTNYEMLMEKVEEVKVVQHDLRHHFRVIDGFLKDRDYDKLSEYVMEYQSVAGQDEPLGYTRNIVADVLFRHYARVALEEQVDFSVRAELGKDAGIPDAELCAILSNLMENAIESCIRVKSGRRFISVTLRQEKAVLSIQMENSAAPIASGSGGFISQKAPGRTGYGLRSIAATAARYDGEAFFEYDESTETFMSTVILLVDSEEQ